MKKSVLVLCAVFVHGRAGRVGAYQVTGPVLEVRDDAIAMQGAREYCRPRCEGQKDSLQMPENVSQ